MSLPPRGKAYSMTVEKMETVFFGVSIACLLQLASELTHLHLESLQDRFGAKLAVMEEPVLALRPVVVLVWYTDAWPST